MVTFEVKTRMEPVLIKADMMEVTECGALVFSVTPDGENGYIRAIAAFAPGCWLRVREVELQT